MGVITKALRLPRIKYFETHLAVINGVLPISITPREIEVLSRFMSFSGDLSSPENRFGTTARKLVKQDLGLSDGGLGNYLKSLKDKGFITTGNDDKLKINPLLMPTSAYQQEYRFLLTNVDEAQEIAEEPQNVKRNGELVSH